MSATLVPGAMVSQSVRLKRPLGAGNMGSVWVAEHLGLQTQVAVKFMSEMAGSNPTNRTRFAREAVAASQVKSPHVVQTFDHGETADGMPFIVMELLEGRDLADRLRDGCLSMREAGSIVSQICLALSRAHAIGVIHRDIKPANVFLCDVGGDEPFVKLLDFGIAKTTNQALAGYATSVGAPIGTPYYMSPEQFLDASQADVRADLWSLAVVVYEGLLGVVPFRATTIGGLVLAINAAEFDPPSRIRDDLPFELDAWFRRALARNPAQRFQTAKEFAESFLSLVSMGASPSMLPPRPSFGPGSSYAAPSYAAASYAAPSYAAPSTAHPGSLFGPPPTAHPAPTLNSGSIHPSPVHRGSPSHGPPSLDIGQATTAGSMAIGALPSAAPGPAVPADRGRRPIVMWSVLGGAAVLAAVAVGAWSIRGRGGAPPSISESKATATTTTTTRSTAPSEARPTKATTPVTATPPSTGAEATPPAVGATVATAPTVPAASTAPSASASANSSAPLASAATARPGAGAGRPVRPGGGPPVAGGKPPGGLVDMGMK